MKAGHRVRVQNKIAGSNSRQIFGPCIATPWFGAKYALLLYAFKFFENPLTLASHGLKLSDTIRYYINYCFEQV
jgi:hypothetical protein